MRTTSGNDRVRFSVKGQVVIPRRLRDAFHIEPGTTAVVEATPEGILLRPLTKLRIRQLRGVLKARPGEKPWAQVWAEHKAEEKRLEARGGGRRTGAR